MARDFRNAGAGRLSLAWLGSTSSCRLFGFIAWGIVQFAAGGIPLAATLARVADSPPRFRAPCKSALP
jgi:hypothetical protein